MKTGEKQTTIVILFMIAIIASTIAVYFYIQSTYHFSYQGLEFEKRDYHGIEIYTYTYNAISPTGEKKPFSLNLRIDPRKNTIPIKDKIELSAIKTNYLTINSTGFNECEYSSVAFGTLKYFLQGNYLPIQGGTVTKEEIEGYEIPIVNCTTHPNNNVILIQKGNESKIEKTNENCYVLTIKDCEVLEVTEKFQVQSILDVRK